MTKRHPTLKRSDYIDSADYARALREAGGPQPHELDSLPCIGEDGAILMGIYGGSSRAFEEEAMYKLADEQAKNPHAFVRKWKMRPGRRGKPNRAN